MPKSSFRDEICTFRFFFCPKSILVLVSGMSFLALARNLSSGSEPASASRGVQLPETTDFDACGDEISPRSYVLTFFRLENRLDDLQITFLKNGSSP